MSSVLVSRRIVGSSNLPVGVTKGCVMQMQRIEQEYKNTMERGELHDYVRRHVVLQQDIDCVDSRIEKLNAERQQLLSWQRKVAEKIIICGQIGDIRTMVFDKTVGVVRWLKHKYSDAKRVEITRTKLERNAKA